MEILRHIRYPGWNKMRELENHIILDKIESWPEEILYLITSQQKILLNYLDEEKRIDKLRKEDLSIRYKRPLNSYEGQWKEINDRIEHSLKKYDILGIHCTKLMDYEIDDILSNGLKPLTKEFANSRIEKLFEKGLISKKLKNKLLNKEEFIEENRIGKICVFHSLSSLKDEWGLNRLFGIWGGEAIYSEIQNPTELVKIGTSCIVFTSINLKDLEFYPELSKRMIAIYLNDNSFPHDADSFIETNLKVLKIIKEDDRLFNKLTGIQNWRDQFF